MSLTLDEVAQIRFRMARRNENGYKVTDVDLFIDKVEETFRQFENERDLMRRELESLQLATVSGDAPVDDADLQSLRNELAARDEEIVELRAEIERLHTLNASLSAGTESEEQIKDLSEQNQQLRSQLARVRAELDEAHAQRIASQSGGVAEQLVITTSSEAAPAVTRLLQMATDQATTLVEEAETEARRQLAEAEQRASEIKADARTRAERIESEARVNAESVTSAADKRAADVDQQAKARRHQLFDDLEREQVVLTKKVGALRSFENDYRTNLTGVLEELLVNINNTHPEPEDVPELAQPSATPRLDALAE
ncbi:MAG: DivIVA domain-containing protein [Tessaracoccus sp.]